MEYIQLTDHGDLPTIGQHAPFKAVLAVEDRVSAARRQLISEWLVEMGGRYVMVCGADCEDWQAAIRRANLKQVNLDDMQPKEFVMITIHQHERLRSVFWHAKKHARHTHVKLRNLVAVHVGNVNRSVEYLAMYDKA